MSQNKTDQQLADDLRQLHAEMIKAKAAFEETSKRLDSTCDEAMDSAGFNIMFSSNDDKMIIENVQGEEL